MHGLVRKAGNALGRASFALTVLFALPAILAAPGCTALRVLRYNFSGVGDYKIFPAREVNCGSEVFAFAQPAPGLRDSVAALLAGDIRIHDVPADRWLEQRGTIAFLLLQGDTLVYERYFAGSSESTIVPSFSVAKSFVSALVGIAISEGYVRDVDQEAADFVPELSGRGLGAVTIRQLLQMTSGIRFKESYSNPLGDAAVFYYGSDLRKCLCNLRPAKSPGTSFSYRSVDPQLLGLVLERATGMPLSTYLETRIWKPLGMEFDASWSLDRPGDGMEKAFCCLNARARDYARFGLLYLKRGLWQGRAIIPEEWVEESVQPVRIGGAAWSYGYLWWLRDVGDREMDNAADGDGRAGDFYAKGLHGQYIYVSPSTDTVIVLLSRTKWRGAPDFFAGLARRLRR